MKSVHTDEYSQFLQLMIAARKDAKITQQQLATALHKPQSYVSKYERGERRLDVVEFLNITKVLKADPHCIIEELRKKLFASPD